MANTVAHENVARYLDEIFGDGVDDVWFADLVDGVVATLEADADRVIARQ